MANPQIQTCFADKKKLVKAHCFIFFAFLSWFFSPTKDIWQLLDLSLAKLFNELIIQSAPWREIVIFWNSKRADWLYDLIMLNLVMLAYQRRRTLPFAAIISTFLIVISLHTAHFRIVSRKLIPVALAYQRKSPSLTLESYTCLSEMKPGKKIKDRSETSFPGDHAFTCSLFIITMVILYGKRWGAVSLLSSLPVLLARPAAGAHWMTDLLFSSLFGLLYLSIVFYTPLYDTIVRKICFSRKTIDYANSHKDL